MDTFARASTALKVVFWKIGTREDRKMRTARRIKSKSILASLLHRVQRGAMRRDCGQARTRQRFARVPSIEECERIVRQMPNPPAMQQDARAWYRPSTDTVGMPSRNAFNSAEEYYSTLFHELTHSTGHTHASRTRRNREAEHVRL